MDAARSGAIEGIVLRYGMFYGLDVPSTMAMIEMVRRRRLPVVRGDAGQLPLIHIDDAVGATVLALDHAPAGSAYDIVDDRAVSLTEIVGHDRGIHWSKAAAAASPRGFRGCWRPYMARMTSVRLPLSNARAKSELGWRPSVPDTSGGPGPDADAGGVTDV